MTASRPRDLKERPGHLMIPSFLSDQRKSGWGWRTGSHSISADYLPAIRPERPAWNQSRIISQKRPLLTRHVWSIRVRLEMAGNRRDLASFNMAVKGKIRGCDQV
ncbi:hypothetical protein GCM10010991_00060 [Gemmobacter aquaticus]|uniref:Uncharacterized protein n=1 Tax=Gemmobacter aquaticus TaxID=490185 RepID=A0A917YFH2_9RHOB|nr:hypothetical protein GCM10010991_00060 [Gemmobacter aquaticus]